jgi:large subunit ribosomal protein L5e
MELNLMPLRVNFIFDVDYYKEAHVKIRADPSPQVKGRQQLSEAEKNERKKFKAQKLTYDQRKAKIAEKKAAWEASLL